MKLSELPYEPLQQIVKWLPTKCRRSLFSVNRELRNKRFRGGTENDCFSSMQLPVNQHGVHSSASIGALARAFTVRVVSQQEQPGVQTAAAIPGPVLQRALQTCGQVKTLDLTYIDGRVQIADIGEKHHGNSVAPSCIHAMWLCVALALMPACIHVDRSDLPLRPPATCLIKLLIISIWT